MSNRSEIKQCPVPRIAGPFVNIYFPGEDVFTLPTATTPDDRLTYVQGKTYLRWRTNDHTFIKGPDQRWHCFGITKPWIPGDNSHTGEGLCFHAIAQKGVFGQTIIFQSWHDMPKISVSDCGWAPASVKIGEEYSLIGSRLERANSSDLITWTPSGELAIKGGNRDPYIIFLDGMYYLYRCDGNGINCVTSSDFINWSNPVTVFKPTTKSHMTESPCIVQYDGLFYLFWTLWDTADPSTSGYCPRSYVHCSQSPLDFNTSPMLTEYTVHAPEIILAEDGQWFISSADYPHQGVSVAPLIWDLEDH